MKTQTPPCPPCVTLPDESRPVYRPGLIITSSQEYPWKWRVHSLATGNEFQCDGEYEANLHLKHFPDSIILKPGVVVKGGCVAKMIKKEYPTLDLGV